MHDRCTASLIATTVRGLARSAINPPIDPLPEIRVVSRVHDRLTARSVAREGGSEGDEGGWKGFGAGAPEQCSPEGADLAPRECTGEP